MKALTEKEAIKALEKIVEKLEKPSKTKPRKKDEGIMAYLKRINFIKE